VEQPYIHETQYRILRGQRLVKLHQHVKRNYELPPLIETQVRADHELTTQQQVGVLRLFYITADNWNDWEYYGALRAGMGRLARAIEAEHYVPFLANINYAMPTFYEPEGRDWRLGTFDFWGNDKDDAPLDVVWTEEQLDEIA
jgi:hypothetical protein